MTETARPLKISAADRKLWARVLAHRQRRRWRAERLWDNEGLCSSLYWAIATGCETSADREAERDAYFRMRYQLSTWRLSTSTGGYWWPLYDSSGRAVCEHPRRAVLRNLIAGKLGPNTKEMES